MLTRLYIDNYKCLVNFEVRLGPEQLLMGKNGSGKSTVFEVLGVLRKLVVEGQRVSDVFPSHTLCRWDARDLQRLEIKLEGNGGNYHYALEIIHPEDAQPSILKEVLLFDDEKLFSDESEVSYAEAFLIDNKGQKQNMVALGERSSLHAIPSKLNSKIAWFRERLARTYILRPDPRAMPARSEKEESSPTESLSNFASWYRHLTQERLSEIMEAHAHLRDVLDGFDSLKLDSEGGTFRSLKALWRLEQNGAGPKKLMTFGFDELSDGQRMLIVLYTMLHALSGLDSTICIDEPDNFLALSEIQPWLSALHERADEHKLQALFISHHPEVINDLATRAGLVFSRTSGGPVRVKPFTTAPDQILTPAELVARGWEDEPG